MNVLGAEFEGFKSFRHRTKLTVHRGLTYITGQNLDSPKMDSNASGKTTLLDFICWMLYGQIPSRVKKDDVINSNSKMVWGRLELEGCTIERTKERNKSEVLRYRKAGDADWTKDSVDLTQAKLEKEVLGISFFCFVNTVYFHPRSMVLRFLDAKPGERIKVLQELVEDEVYRHSAEVTANRIKAIDVMTGRLRSRIEQWEAIESRAVAELQQINTTLDEESKNREAIRQRMAEEILGCHAQIAKLKERFTNPVGFDEKDIKQRLIATDSRLRALDQYIAEQRVNAAISTLKAGEPCPLCQQAITAMHCAELDIKRRAAETNMAKAERSKKEELGTLTNLKENLSRCQDIEMEREKARLQIGNLEDRIRVLEDQALPQQDVHLMQRRSSLELEINDLKANIVDATNQILRERKDYDMLLEWKQAFAKDIRDMLFDQVRVGLDYHANIILRDLFGSDYRIACPTVDRKKDEFVIEVYKGKHARDIAMYSGGERFRLDMGLMLAFRKILLTTRTCPFTFLLLDELGEGLDETGRETMQEHLGRLLDSKEFTTILATMPRSDLAAGERKITVTIKNEESSLG